MIELCSFFLVCGGLAAVLFFSFSKWSLLEIGICVSGRELNIFDGNDVFGLGEGGGSGLGILGGGRNFI